MRNLEASKKFYCAVFETLGVPLGGEGADFFWCDELFVSSKESYAAATHELTGRTHLAFQASDKETVDKFYRAAVAAGGKENGAPGLREKYHPGYYAAFVQDPDGNNIEVVYHGPAQRSAPSVKFTWE